MNRFLLFTCILLFTIAAKAQELPDDPQMHAIIDSVSVERIEADIRISPGLVHLLPALL